MHVDTASDIDDDESAADMNDITENDATLFATFKASGLPASLKGRSCAQLSQLGPRCKGQEWQARLP
eukprot:2637225-Pleurochrysis_carterae.AAC.1